MTYLGRDYLNDAEYWFKLAKVTISRPLLPQRCELTDKLLWLKPAMRGETSYYMRSGTKRYDIRWMDQQTFTLFALKYKGTSD